VVQNACKSALIYPQLPSATSSPMLPVVSEWYQKATANAFEVAVPNERSFYTLTVFRARGDASSLDRYLHWIPTMDGYATEGMDEVLGWATYSCPFLPLGGNSCRSHKETWAGCIVSLTTPTRLSLKASRSVSSLSLAEKASRVFLASYFPR
jgi:hypothetical protein